MKFFHWLKSYSERSSRKSKEMSSDQTDAVSQTASKKEFYSKENLLSCLKYYDELRFGEKNGRNLIIEDKTPFEFSIKRSAHENFILQNYSRGNSKICCNAYEINSVDGQIEDQTSPYSALDFQRIGASFIYDKPFNKTKDGKSEFPSFLYGFDPDLPEIWRMDPEKDRGVEICAEKFTKKFILKDGVAGVGPLDFVIRPSEFVGIYGNSGTGKTILIESLIAPTQKNSLLTRLKEKINFLLSPNQCSGTLKIDGGSTSRMAPFVSYLPQEVDFPKNLKCIELLNIALSDRSIFDTQKRRKIIVRTLTMCALDENILLKRCNSLSGGQRRRMALALTILKKDTRLLIADEPTTGLDVASEQAVMRTLKQLSRRGITVITITHSVASCRLFDRVLILRKADSQHTAEISYDGIWDESIFPDVIKKQNYTDAQGIAFLADPNSKFFLPESTEKEVDWPFPYGEKFVPPPRAGRLRLWANRLNEYCWWLYDTICQSPSWFMSSWKMLRRDLKTLSIFFFMAVFCVLAMLIGTGTAQTQPLIRLFSMLTLAAPWLCATFAAIFMADKLKFYSWEKLSGVHSLSFLLGGWCAQILPVTIISAVFTCGMFISPETKVITQKTFSWFYNMPQDPSIQSELQQTEDTSSNTEKVLRYVDTQYGFSKKDNPYIFQLFNIFSERQIDSKIRNIYQGDEDKLENRRKDFFDAEKSKCYFYPWFDFQQKNFNAIYTKKDVHGVMIATHNDHTNDHQNVGKAENDFFQMLPFFVKHFPRCYLVMLLVGMVGAAIGIASIAVFRRINSATIAIVVIFIMFLVYSPMFFEPGREIYCPGIHWSIDCDQNLSMVPSGLLSYLCLGRYAFNLICFPNDHPEYIGQLYPLLWMLFIALAIAGYNLGNKTKNWKALTR